MPYQPLHLTALLCLAISIVGAAGCSRVSIAYNSADFLIERYARDYLALEDPQVATWRPQLEGALADHRREHLPYLASFFDTALAGVSSGFDRRRMDCLLSQLEDLYRRHMRMAVDLAAPLLADLRPDQIRALGARFREEEIEDRADTDPGSIQRRERKRAERYQESIEWWTGPLRDTQKVIVREETAAMPDTAVAWISYRGARREALVDLLERQASEEEIRRFLGAWLVEHRDLPAGLGVARDRMRERISAMLVRIVDSLDAAQRGRFAERLTGLREDMLSLQPRPRMASVRCADAG